MSFTAAVVTISDSCFRAAREDESGDILERLLTGAGAVRPWGEPGVERVTVPDERGLISAELLRLSGPGRVDLVITTGGTGMSPRDLTPEATMDVIEREAPGFAEAIRSEARKTTPYAMLSRAVSGIRGATLILNFPGSPQAAGQSFEAVKPALGHALELLSGKMGECAGRREADPARDDVAPSS